MVYMPVILASLEVEKGALWSEASPGHRWLMPVILATQEDCSLKPAWTNSSQDSILKKTLYKKKKKKKKGGWWSSSRCRP
jgi:hypothetical protein